MSHSQQKKDLQNQSCSTIPKPTDLLVANHLDTASRGSIHTHTVYSHPHISLSPHSLSSLCVYTHTTLDAISTPRTVTIGTTLTRDHLQHFIMSKKSKTVRSTTARKQPRSKQTSWKVPTTRLGNQKGLCRKRNRPLLVPSMKVIEQSAQQTLTLVQLSLQHSCSSNDDNNNNNNHDNDTSTAAPAACLNPTDTVDSTGKASQGRTGCQGSRGGCQEGC